uniref:PNPLA domain-containing protein n=1 Tax=Acrobeloides nanus TaxID=290746 RepID=A0A914D965_9BILA
MKTLDPGECFFVPTSFLDMLNTPDRPIVPTIFFTAMEKKEIKITQVKRYSFNNKKHDNLNSIKNAILYRFLTCTISTLYNTLGLGKPEVFLSRDDYKYPEQYQEDSRIHLTKFFNKNSKVLMINQKINVFDITQPDQPSSHFILVIDGSLNLNDVTYNRFDMLIVESSTSVNTITKSTILITPCEATNLENNLDNQIFWLLRSFTPLTRTLETFVDLVDYETGQAVYVEQEKVDAGFVVVEGRLRSVLKAKKPKLTIEAPTSTELSTDVGGSTSSEIPNLEADDNEVEERDEEFHLLEEFRSGDAFGFVKLQRKPMSTTVFATRKSKLAVISDTLLKFTQQNYPKFFEIVPYELEKNLNRFYRIKPDMPETFLPELLPIEAIRMIKNLHTVAIIPASKNVPLTATACELYHAMKAYISVQILYSGNYVDELSRSSNEDLLIKLRLEEETNQLVIYQCDNVSSQWTQCCLDRADYILVVSKSVKKMSKDKEKKESKQSEELDLSFLEDDHLVRTRKELLVLWDEVIDNTLDGILERFKKIWFCRYHHVLLTKRMKNNQINDDAQLRHEYEILEFDVEIEKKTDFSRIARFLMGRTIGLVLGGGGARGAAHIGVINAIRKAGLPIDMIGGTSIGSMISGLLASEKMIKTEKTKSGFSKILQFYKRFVDKSKTTEADDLVISSEEYARKYFANMSIQPSNIINIYKALNLSTCSILCGEYFKKNIYEHFGDSHIEELVLPYFCISTNISKGSEMRVHCKGPLYKYVTASMSFPILLPAVQDFDKCYLIDGGICNNVPVDIMKELGARYVIAVDVGATTQNNFKECPAIWKILVS